MSFGGMMVMAQPKLVSTVKKPASKPPHPLTQSESTNASIQPRKTQPTRTDSAASHEREKEKKDKKHGFGFFGGGKKKPSKESDTSRSISPSPTPYESPTPWDDPGAPQPPPMTPYKAPASFPNHVSHNNEPRYTPIDIKPVPPRYSEGVHEIHPTTAGINIEEQPQIEPKRSQPVHRPAELILEGKTNLRPDDLPHVQNRRRPVEDEARAPQAHILQFPVLKEIRVQSPKTGSMPPLNGVAPMRAPTIPQRAPNRPSMQMETGPNSSDHSRASSRGESEWEEEQLHQQQQIQQIHQQPQPQVQRPPQQARPQAQLQVQLPPPPQRYLSIDFVPSPKSLKSLDRKDFSPPAQNDLLDSYFPLDESIREHHDQNGHQNGDWWKQYPPPQELFYIPETIPDGLLAFFDDDELDAEIERIRNPPRIPTPAELIPQEIKEHKLRSGPQNPYERNSASSPGASSTAFSRGSVATSYTGMSVYAESVSDQAAHEANSRWSISSTEDFPMRKVKSRAESATKVGAAIGTAMMAKTAPAKKSGGDVNCNSCKNEVRKKKSVSLECGHSYCQKCMRHHIITSMEKESTFPPKCCNVQIPTKTIGSVCTVADRAALHQKTLEFKVSIDRRIYCPNAKCGRFIPLFPSSKSENAFCARCEISICQECKGKAHPAGTACPGADALEEFPAANESINAGWRRCFDCRAIVKRSTDVESHLACRCGAEFCFVCGLVWRTCTCEGHEPQIPRQQAVAQRQQAAELDTNYQSETESTQIPPQQASAQHPSPKTWLFDAPEELDEERPGSNAGSSIATATQQQQHTIEIPKRVDSLTAKYDELRAALESIIDEQESRMNDRLVGIRTEISARRFERDAKHQQVISEKKSTVDSRAAEKSATVNQEQETAISDLQLRHEDEEDDVWLGLRTRLRDTPGPQRVIREKNVIDKLKARQGEELEALKLQFSAELNSIRTIVEGEIKKEVAELNKRRDTERIVEDAEQRESTRKEMADGKWFEAVRRSRRDRMALMFLAEKDEERIQQLETELSQSFNSARAVKPQRMRKNSQSSQISSVSHSSNSTGMRSQRTSHRVR